MANRRALGKQLMKAVQTGDIGMVTTMLDEDPSLVSMRNSHHNVPLGVAVMAGNLPMVQLLVARGADPHHRNHGGHSVLDGAAFSGHVAIAAFIIECGVTPTVHHLAAMGDIDALADGLAREPSLLASSAAGGRWRMSPLHAVAMSGSLTGAQYLISAGAVVDEQNHHGHTPLAVAIDGAAEGVMAVAELLLTHGADANAAAGHHGGTVLHRAVINGNADAVALLLAHYASPDRQDWSGKTPLHHAVSRNRKLTELIVARKPDLAIESKQSETARQLAVRLGKTAVIKALDVNA
jgi:ankyrin repeat protein